MVSWQYDTHSRDTSCLDQQVVLIDAHGACGVSRKAREREHFALAILKRFRGVSLGRSRPGRIPNVVHLFFRNPEGMCRNYAHTPLH